MRVPLSWLRPMIPGLTATAEEVAAALVRAGLEVEQVHRVGYDVSGVVVGRVLDIEELTGHKKPIRFCHVDIGAQVHEVVCGAVNFAVGDLVPFATPGAVLPGDFRIATRQTYGRTSDGMVCSARELGVGEEAGGIMVLAPDSPLGTDVVDLLLLRDEVLDIAVTPDRGYTLSVRGVARETATAFGLAFEDPAALAFPAAGAGHPVRIDAVDGCDRYVARTATGLDPSARSPLWLQRRLALAGMRSISLAVDVTNAVMLELGQPLHAFDLDRLTGEIAVRRARSGERLLTLDGQDRSLDPDDLVIADDSGPIAIAGVMGGASTEISGATSRLLIESAHFAPLSVARTARRHRLPSEASRRFERGVDPALAPAAAELALRMLVALGGASPGPVTDVDGRLPSPVVLMPVAAPGRLAGRHYSPDVVRRRLTDVGCTVTSAPPAAGSAAGGTAAGIPPAGAAAGDAMAVGEAMLDVLDAAVAGDLPLEVGGAAASSATQHPGAAGELLEVVPPSWRPDLVAPADLIEEVVRLEGYDTIPAALPTAPAGRGLTAQQRLRRTASRALASAGLVEVVTPPFVSDELVGALGLVALDPPRLANPLSEAEALLRPSLLPGLLLALDRNARRGLTSVALYETGAVFLGRGRSVPSPGVDRRPSGEQIALLDSGLPAQPRHAALVLSGGSAGWMQATAAVLALGRALGLRLTVQRADQPPWHPGRCAQVLLDGWGVGFAGELHPRVTAAMSLPDRTCAAEVDLDALVEAAAARGPVAAPLVSPYPPASVDVALVVQDKVPAAEVEMALRDGAGALLEDLRLFDVYVGPQVEEGHRSLAYALRLRAADRTLTDTEVLAARDAAVAEATSRVGAVLRSV